MSQALNPTQMLWLEQARKQEEEFVRKQNEERQKACLIPGLPDIKNVNDAAQWIESNENLWADCERRGDLESLRRFKTDERLELVDRCRRFIASSSTPVTYTPPPVPERAAHPGQFWQPKTNAPYTYAANPALTRTAPNPQVVQWTQGNRLIMRPENREVAPGEPTTSVRILR